VDLSTACSPWAPLARVGAVSTLISTRVPIRTPVSRGKVADNTRSIMPWADGTSRPLLDAAGERGSAGYCVHLPDSSLSTVGAICQVIRRVVQCRF
jgi:hypothetical protein